MSGIVGRLNTALFNMAFDMWLNVVFNLRHGTQTAPRLATHQ
jgi:hypothetical protein